MGERNEMSVWSNLLQEVEACIGYDYDVEGVAEKLYNAGYNSVDEVSSGDWDLILARHVIAVADLEA